MKLKICFWYAFTTNYLIQRRRKNFSLFYGRLVVRNSIKAHRECIIRASAKLKSSSVDTAYWWIMPKASGHLLPVILGSSVTTSVRILSFTLRIPFSNCQKVLVIELYSFMVVDVKVYVSFKGLFLWNCDMIIGARQSCIVFVLKPACFQQFIMLFQAIFTNTMAFLKSFLTAQPTN